MNKKFVVIAIVVLVLVALVSFRRSTSDLAPEGQMNVAAPTEMTNVQDSSVAVASIMPTAEVKPIALTISSPANGSTTRSSSISIKGKTAANAEVFVNESEGKADASGNFSISVTLEEGENYFIVLANDSLGNSAEAELTVIYEP